jgi:hypothetical protein
MSHHPYHYPNNNANNIYLQYTSFAIQDTRIMSKNNPLEGLPVNGIFPLTLSPAFVAAVGGGKGAKEDVIGMKCTSSLSTLKFSHINVEGNELMIDAFKPESITPETEGRLDMNKGRATQLSFDTKVRALLLCPSSTASDIHIVNIHTNLEKRSKGLIK